MENLNINLMDELEKLIKKEALAMLARENKMNIRARMAKRASHHMMTRNEQLFLAVSNKAEKKLLVETCNHSQNSILAEEDEVATYFKCPVCLKYLDCELK